MKNYSSDYLVEAILENMDTVGNAITVKNWDDEIVDYCEHMLNSYVPSSITKKNTRIKIQRAIRYRLRLMSKAGYEGNGLAYAQANEF